MSLAAAFEGAVVLAAVAVALELPVPELAEVPVRRISPASARKAVSRRKIPRHPTRSEPRK